MSTVNMHEAKTHLSKLVARVEQGESITIAKAGKPVAMVVPLQKNTKPAPFGWLDGMFTVPEDIKKPFEKEIDEMFYGKE